MQSDKISQIVNGAEIPLPQDGFVSGFVDPFFVGAAKYSEPVNSESSEVSEEDPIVDTPNFNDYQCGVVTTRKTRCKRKLICKLHSTKHQAKIKRSKDFQTILDQLNQAPLLFKKNRKGFVYKNNKSNRSLKICEGGHKRGRKKKPLIKEAVIQVVPVMNAPIVSENRDIATSETEISIDMTMKSMLEANSISFNSSLASVGPVAQVGKISSLLNYCSSPTSLNLYKQLSFSSISNTQISSPFRELSQLEDGCVNAANG